MPLQSPWVLPEQVCQGRCGTSCATCGVALRHWHHQRRGETGCAFASICVPTPTMQILPCAQELPWLWPWRAVAATPHPHQPNVRQSRCPRPPICSVLLPTLGMSSLCLSGLESSIGVCCSRVRFACTCQRGSQCDVNRQLRPRRDMGDPVPTPQCVDHLWLGHPRSCSAETR